MIVADVPNIPIGEIRVVNPRVRSRVTFEQIVSSVSTLGLKNPIIVSQRDVEEDGTRYDLVCGQGRIEALLALGQVQIPALIVQASREDQFLMSLVENIARRPPSDLGLVREVKSLLERGYTLDEIADKLGHTRQYISTITVLIKNGESQLIGMVESGKIPITVATQIATGTSADVQKALTAAYESGDLRGPKLKAARQLIKRRLKVGRTQGVATKKSSAPLTAQAAAREYREHTQAQRALVKRAAVVRERLALICAACGQLFADENFRTLLRAEGLTLVSEKLMDRINAL